MQYTYNFVAHRSQIQSPLPLPLPLPLSSPLPLSENVCEPFVTREKEKYNKFSPASYAIWDTLKVSTLWTCTVHCTMAIIKDVVKMVAMGFCDTCILIYGTLSVQETKLWRSAQDWQRQVIDGGVVRAGVSVTRNVLSWSEGHKFEPQSGRTFCPKWYLNRK